MNLFSDALSAASAALQLTASEVVTYRRGELSAQVVMTRAGIRVPDGGGEIIANADVIDWLCEPSALRLGGELTEPQRADQIIPASGEVFDLLPGNPSDYSDSRKTYHRIHTVRRSS